MATKTAKSAATTKTVLCERSFTIKKQTQGTIVYQEDVGPTELPCIGSLYIRKTCIARNEGGTLPRTIRVTVEVTSVVG